MRHRRTRLGLLLFTLALGSANACSNQTEGQRCDKLSGNDDCEAGLICTTTVTQTGTMNVGKDGGTIRAPATYSAAVCCPPAGVTATTAACQSISIGAGNGTGGSDTGGTGGTETGGTGGTETGGMGGTATGGAGGTDGGGTGGVPGRDAGLEAGPGAAVEAGP